MRALILIATIVFQTPLAHGQIGSSTSAPASIAGPRLQGLPSSSKPNANPVRMTSEMNVRIPSGLPEVKSKGVQELLKKLKETCPECSTGGTVGGTVIIGGNDLGGGATDLGAGTGTLWPLQEYVRIKKSEYDELKRKASFYDLQLASKKN